MIRVKNFSQRKSHEAWPRPIFLDTNFFVLFVLLETLPGQSQEEYFLLTILEAFHDALDLECLTLLASGRGGESFLWVIYTRSKERKSMTWLDSRIIGTWMLFLNLLEHEGRLSLGQNHLYWSQCLDSIIKSKAKVM